MELLALLLLLPDALGEELCVLGSSLKGVICVGDKNMGTFKHKNNQNTTYLLGRGSGTLLQCEPVALALEGEGGDKALDLGCLGVWLLSILGGELAANDVLANVVLLGQVLTHQQNPSASVQHFCRYPPAPNPNFNRYLRTSCGCCWHAWDRGAWGSACR